MEKIEKVEEREKIENIENMENGKNGKDYTISSIFPIYAGLRSSLIIHPCLFLKSLIHH